MANKPKASERWIGCGEAAEILGVSRDTVNELVSKGKFPAWRPGGRDIRMVRADVLKYLESTRVKPRA